MEKRVYVSGALTGTTGASQLKHFYESIGTVFKRAGYEVYIPHANGTDPVKDPDVAPSAVFDTDVREVGAASLLVAYVGVPSLGVGMELAYAERLGHPIILLWEKGREVSRLVRGIPTISAHIEFESHADALQQLEDLLKKASDNSGSPLPTVV